MAPDGLPYGGTCLRVALVPPCVVDVVPEMMSLSSTASLCTAPLALSITLLVGMVALAVYCAVLRRQLHSKKVAEGMQWQRTKWKATLFDTAYDILCIVEFTGAMRCCNHSLARLLGYTIDEIESMNLKDFIHDDDKIRTCMEFKKLCTGQPTLRFESRWRTKDGAYKSIEWNAVPDLQHFMINFVGRDVTEMKERFNDLEAKKSAAEMETQSKREFLAVMSHEIRTPLNGVLATANLLRDTSLSAEQVEYIDIIRSSGTALLSVINDILDFSRIESKKLQLEMCDFDLVECLEESIDLCSGPAAEKQLDLTLLIDETVPTRLIGDPARLRQVLVNLGSNGVKFTPQGEVSFRVQLASPALVQHVQTIQAQEESFATLPGASATGSADTVKSFGAGQSWQPPDEDAIYVHLQVQDTGIGMPAEGRDRLFQSFSQMDSSTTRKFGGSGLGLAICYALCRLMRGHIWVESDGPGKGCTFHVVVRLFRSPQPAPPRVSRATLGIVRGVSVLFADDTRSCRLMLQRHARALELQARFAATGQQVLEEVTRGSVPAVIVLDEHMPSMSGPEVARRLRLAGCRARIVLMTHRHLRGVSERAELPWDAECLKPVKLAQLKRVLVELLCPTAQPLQTSPTAWPNDRSVRSRLRILVAEDVVVNQRVAVMQIQKCGYSAPDVVSNGQEVLDALSRLDYDVVLMDVSMPVLDGIEATKRLRARRPREHGPMVIAMTANVLPAQIRKCMDCGMDGYISKPVSIAELEAALRRAEEAAPQYAASLAMSRGFSPRLGEALPRQPSVSLPETVVAPAMAAAGSDAGAGRDAPAADDGTDSVPAPAAALAATAAGDPLAAATVPARPAAAAAGSGAPNAAPSGAVSAAETPRRLSEVSAQSQPPAQEYRRRPTATGSLLIPAGLSASSARTGTVSVAGTGLVGNGKLLYSPSADPSSSPSALSPPPPVSPALSPPAASTAHLLQNRSTLAVLREAGMLQEVCSLFTTVAVDTVTQLDTALARRDLKLLQDTAHALVGAAGSVGALGLMQQLRDVEQRADLPTAAEVRDLQRLVQAVSEALAVECASAAGMACVSPGRAAYASSPVAGRAPSA